MLINYSVFRCWPLPGLTLRGRPTRPSSLSCTAKETYQPLDVGEAPQSEPARWKKTSGRPEAAAAADLGSDATSPDWEAKAEEGNETRRRRRLCCGERRPKSELRAMGSAASQSAPRGRRTRSAPPHQAALRDLAGQRNWPVPARDKVVVRKSAVLLALLASVEGAGLHGLRKARFLPPGCCYWTAQSVLLCDVFIRAGPEAAPGTRYAAAAAAAAMEKPPLADGPRPSEFRHVHIGTFYYWIIEH